MKNNVDILIFTYEFLPYKGGYGEVALQLAESLSMKNKKVIVLAPKYPKSSIKKTEKISKKILLIRFPLTTNKFRYISGFLYLCYVLTRYKPAFVWANEETSQRITAFCALFMRIKFIVMAHGSDINLNLRNRILKRIFKKIIYERAYYIFTNSNFSKLLLIKKYEVENRNIDTILLGVNRKILNKKINKKLINALKSKYHLKNKKILLTVARLTPRKGHDKVIKALKIVKKQFPNVVYIIVGKGENEKHLKLLASSYKLNKHIIFTNSVREEVKIAFYDICDIFIMTSRKIKHSVEGFGLALIEANARGKPVIASNHGGMPEAILHGKTGLIINPKNDHEIAIAIIKLLKNKQYAIQLGKNGRKRCISELNWDNISRKIINILKI